jgi:hypothetical protein
MWTEIAVCIVTGYRLDSLGIKSSRSQWPSGLRWKSAADRLLELRVQIPPEAWMFVCCRQRYTYIYVERVREMPGGGGAEPVEARLSAPIQKGPWHPPSLLYNGYRLTCPGVKRLGHGINHPRSSSPKDKERVELYLYSPSGSSRPVLGQTLPFT